MRYTLTNVALALSLALPVRAEEASEAEPVGSTAPAGETEASNAEKTRAAALFDEAVALATKGEYPTACRKLEESLALYDAVGTSFHLAGCWQRIGRTASAHALFDKVAHRTFELGQTERALAARDRRDALVPKLSRLRVDVEARGKELVIRKNGELVAEGEYGRSLPVDRGAYEVTAEAEGKAPWSGRIEVSEPGITYVLTIPELDATTPPAPRTTRPLRQPRSVAPAVPKEESSGSGRYVSAYSLVGIGALGVAGGVLLGMRYRDKNQQAEAICPTSVRCTTAEINDHARLVDEAKQARTWMFVAAGAGGLALGTAGVLFLTAPSERRSAKARVWAEPLVSECGSLGASVGGSF
jgi:hypothetical protein